MGDTQHVSSTLLNSLFNVAVKSGLNKVGLPAKHRFCSQTPAKPVHQRNWEVLYLAGLWFNLMWIVFSIILCKNFHRDKLNKQEHLNNSFSHWRSWVAMLLQIAVIHCFTKSIAYTIYTLTGLLPLYGWLPEKAEYFFWPPMLGSEM